uniref:Putative e3 ubiquitin ligase n=1 Tax=Rhipicephalus pulchellus TaxID=72859 RepID=L7M4N4_RHIPC
MTRWARSKSVLKHERQPGEATTWSEFVSQRQQATKPRFARLDDAGANTKLLNTEKKLPESSNLAVKKKLSSTDSVGPEPNTHSQGVAGDAVHLKKAAAASSNKPSQHVSGNYSHLQAKGKSASKRKEVSVHDEEGEALEKLMLKHRKTDADTPVAQKTMGAASKKKLAVVPVPSSSTANAGSTGSTLPRKIVKTGSPSIKKKARLPKSNISAAHIAVPASKSKLSPSPVTKKCSDENEAQSSAQVPKAGKKKVITKKLLPSFRKEVPLPIKGEGKSGSSVSERPVEVGKRKGPGQKARTAATNKEALPIDENEEDGNSEGEEEQPVPKVRRTGPHVDGDGSGKAKRLQRLRQEREAKGLLLLPEKVERRIYLTKKAMRKKGLPGEQIKEAVRKMRRKEELLFRRQLAKLCFKCRQPGHRVSDCPQMLQDSSEPIGICFKCGSTEHFSSACTVQTSKDNEFPYAKCFICKQQGHLSRKCPRNDKGVYPKGGHCNFCGAIDHFKKECPEMEKNKSKNSEESEVAADIVSIGQSADAENIVPLHQGVQLKKKKVVSF